MLMVKESNKNIFNCKIIFLLSKTKMAAIKTAKITYLLALTPYSYRLRAQNNTGTFMSGIVVFRDIF